MTVFGTLKNRLTEFMLPKIVEVVSQSLAAAIALFRLVPAKTKPR